MTPTRFRLQFGPALSVALVLLAVYILTLCPTVGTGDSGELTMAAATLSVPHPTGYPLYILLGRLFILLVPVSEIAVRMNLFSAVAAAAACGVMVRWLRIWSLSTPAAVSAGLALGLSLSFWGEANVARVYALNALLIGLALYWGVRPERTFRSRALFCLFWGLGMANHTLALFTGLLVLLTELADLKTARRHASAALFVLPGLLLYLWIPLRARMDPPLNFGDADSWSAFRDYILRTHYWQNSYVETLPDFLRVLGHYLSTIPVEFTWLGVVLIPAGLAGLATARAGRLLFVAVGHFLVNAAVVGLHGSAQDIFHWSRYLIPGYLGVAVILAFGVDYLGRIGDGAPGARTELSGRAVSPFTRRAARILRPLAVVLLPLLLLVTNRVPNDKSQDTLAYTYNYRILASLPPDAVLMPSGDNNVFPILYLQAVEGIRPDVSVIASYYRRDSAVPLVLAPGLFYTNILFDLPQGTHPRVEGLLFRILSSPEAPRVSRGWQGWRIPEMNNMDLARRDMLTRLLASQYWFFAGMAIPEGRDLLFQRSLDISHDYDRMWEQIAKTYFLLGRWKEARPIAERALELNPKNRDAALLIRAIDDTLRAVAAGDTLPPRTEAPEDTAGAADRLRP